ncbi:MAG: C10 family peptidase [Prevotella sp.]|nr:C10 family peptidase [Prevotella sp.]
MKRTVLLFVVAAMMTGAATAAPITREQARQKAEGFMQRMGMKSGLEEVANSRGKTKPAEEGEPLYVFNMADDGFVIISGDDRTADVLGYVQKGRYDYDQLPCNVRAFIDGYAEQIRFMQQRGSMKGTSFQSSHATIEPMLTCHWGQNAPYYNECPDFFEYGKCVTGCVATALAQILYYHRSKAVTNVTLAEITAYDCKNNWTVNDVEKGNLHVDGIPAESPIDWANMQDDYDATASEAAEQAVAQLLKYCGAGLRMEYGYKSSSAADISAAVVAKKYFGFRRDASFLYHENMTVEEWDNTIYGELAAGRPVLMGGDNGKGGGHAFVCDGYNASTSMYHINWGWEGEFDGEFYLSSLDPKGQGTGGSEGGYNNGQDMLINMEPGDGQPYVEPIVMTTKTLELTGETTVRRNSEGKFYFDYTFMYANSTSDVNSFDLGLAIYQGESLVQEMMAGTSSNVPMTNLSGFSGTCEAGAGLAEGTYEIWPVSRAAGSSEWLQNDGPYYILAEVGSNEVTLKRKVLKKGDVNHDDHVTPADAIMILYHYFNVAQNGFCLKAADLNNDGLVTPADAIEALYMYFGTNAGSNARATQPLTGSTQSPE